MGTREPETVMSGTLDQHSRKFSGFSLRFIFPRHRAKETGDPEMPTGQQIKAPTEAYSFYPKDQERGKLARPKTFRKQLFPSS